MLSVDHIHEFSYFRADVGQDGRHSLRGLAILCLAERLFTHGQREEAPRPGAFASRRDAEVHGTDPTRCSEKVISIYSYSLRY